MDLRGYLNGRFFFHFHLWYLYSSGHEVWNAKNKEIHHDKE